MLFTIIFAFTLNSIKLFIKKMTPEIFFGCHSLTDYSTFKFFADISVFAIKTNISLLT